MLSLMNKYLPVFDAEDEGAGGSGSGDAGAKSGGEGDGSGSEPSPSDAYSFLADDDKKFIKDDQSLDAESLYSELTESRKKVTARDADLRKALSEDPDFVKSVREGALQDHDFMKSIQDKFDRESRAADAPEDPTGYEVNLPKDLLPEHLKFEVNSEDPLLQWWQQTCHEKGFGQEQFNAGVAQYVQGLLENEPDPAAEQEILGENAKERSAAVETYFKQALDENEFQVVQSMASTARGVEVLEKLMNFKSDPQLDRMTQTIATTPELSQAEVHQLMAHPEYGQNTEKGREIKSKVDAYFIRKTGGK